MNRNAFVILGCGASSDGRTKDVCNVRLVFYCKTIQGESAPVAAGAGVGNPRRRRVLSILIQKDGQVFAGFRMALRRGGRPVNEGSLENGRGIVRFENPEAV